MQAPRNEHASGTPLTMLARRAQGALLRGIYPWRAPFPQTPSAPGAR